MKRPRKGQSVYLSDTRSRRRPVLLWYEQRLWFWLMCGLCAFVLAGLGFWKFAGGGLGRGPVACGLLAGWLAVGLVVLIRRERFGSFHEARARRRAQRAEKELERFVVVLLRELRLPLRNMRRSLEAVQARLQATQQQPAGCAESAGMGVDADGDRHTEMAGACRRTVVELDRIDRLAAGLLRLARSRRAELHRQWVDANSLVVALVAEMDPLVHRSGATIRMQTLPACLADADLLRQAFAALIENALEYTSPRRPPEVRIWGWQQGRWVHYSVQDNGIGIPDDELERIFETFYRVDPGDDGPRGLGLPIARRAVEQHGGRFWVHSRPGRGSTFTFALPVK